MASNEEQPKAEARKGDGEEREAGAAKRSRSRTQQPTEDEPKEKAAKAEMLPVGFLFGLSVENSGEAGDAKKGKNKSEPELDAAEDDRPTIDTETITFLRSQATPNLLPLAGGKLLTSINDGGLQYLLVGARANVGVRAGRYMFEVRIVEHQNPDEGRISRGTPVPMPRQLLRVGFSLAGPTLLLQGQTADTVYFDSDGHYVHMANRARVASRFGREHVVTLVLNLDQDSPNKNTLTMFQDGKLTCEPQPLPEHLIGKTLYPHITFKNVTVHVNFGPIPRRPLPFKCRMLQNAAEDDVDMAPATSEKPEVLFPIGLPDHGLFDWIDQYMEEHLGYCELSDRKILEWAQKSNVSRQGGYSSVDSNDRPGMHFGIPMLDDRSIQQALAGIAPGVRQNFVLLEMKANLLAEQRRTNLRRFPADLFKRIAIVAMGEPSEDYKAKVHALMLSEKVKAAEDEKRKAAERAEREARQRRGPDSRRSADEQEKKRVTLRAREEKQIDEAKTKVAALEQSKKEEKSEGNAKTDEKNAAEKEERGEAKEEEEKKDGEEKNGEKKEEENNEGEQDEGEKKDDENKVDDNKDDKKKGDEDDDDGNKDDENNSAENKGDEEKDGESKEAQKNKSEDTKEDDENKEDEEKKGEEMKDEEMKDEKKDEEKKDEEMKDEEKKDEEQKKDEKEKPIQLTEEEKAVWYRKLATPDLKPSTLSEVFANFSLPSDAEGFDEIRFVWQDAEQSANVLRTWILGQKRVQRVEELQPSAWFKERWDAWEKALQELKKKKHEAKAAVPKKKEPEKKKDDVEESGENEGGEKPAEANEDDKAKEIDEEDIDAMTHEDIHDIGNGKPLYGNFAYEDWMLLGLAYELHLLVHSFRRDLNDPDRPSFHESHLGFYYNKYYRKSLTLDSYGCSNLVDLVALIKDSIAINEKTAFIDTLLSADEPTEKFVRFTEERRRERQRCVDAGDETARLRFVRPPPPAPRHLGTSSRGGDAYGRDSYSRNDTTTSRSGGYAGGGYSRGDSGYSRGGSGGGSYSGGASGAPTGSSSQKRYPWPPAGQSSDQPSSKHARYVAAAAEEEAVGTPHVTATATPPGRAMAAVEAAVGVTVGGGSGGACQAISLIASGRCQHRGIVPAFACC
eukprot:CAMPEP_0117480056 /NCGR_PEP_ID=MMETSP0784-20121206/12198_1 /TAXON_ID=39447 /ORGANISM="" /LENGTH=1129 /DNA_ID=CAMNT_0005274491 /DNA_START=36 /DNA_END=3423 /DNA_ORIENTATION=-